MFTMEMMKRGFIGGLRGQTRNGLQTERKNWVVIHSRYFPLFREKRELSITYVHDGDETNFYRRAQGSTPNGLTNKPREKNLGTRCDVLHY